MKREGANFNRTTALWGSAVLAVFGPIGLSTAFGQVSFSNQTGLVYSQNFNGLKKGGSGGYTSSWANNFSSLLSDGSGGPGGPTDAGWYAHDATSGAGEPTFYTASSGNNSVGLYSFGSPTNADSATSSAERALGAYPNGASGGGSYYIGLQLRYTGSGILPTINQLQVIYRGEAWYDSTSENTTMTFQYQISTSAIAINASSGWNNVSELYFAHTGDNPGGTKDGNGSGNFSQKNHLITGISIADEQFVMLRWTIPNTSGSDHAFAIDDVFIAVPEAGTWAAGALIGGSLLNRVRRSRQIAA